MHKAIIFNGPPGSGKDTAARLTQLELRKRLIGAVRMSIAQPMKDAVHRFYDLKYSKPALEKLKDIPLDQLQGRTLRDEYIDFSEQFIKPRMGVDFFGKQFVNRLQKRTKDTVILITDCGFNPEYQVIQEYLGKENVMVLKMVRQNRNFENDSRDYIDPNGSFHIPVFNHRNMEALKGSLRSVIERHFIPKILSVSEDSI